MAEPTFEIGDTIQYDGPYIQGTDRGIVIETVRRPFYWPINDENDLVTVQTTVAHDVHLVALDEHRTVPALEEHLNESSYSNLPSVREVVEALDEQPLRKLYNSVSFGRFNVETNFTSRLGLTNPPKGKPRDQLEPILTKQVFRGTAQQSELIVRRKDGYGYSRDELILQDESEDFEIKYGLTDENSLDDVQQGTIDARERQAGVNLEPDPLPLGWFDGEGDLFGEGRVGTLKAYKVLLDDPARNWRFDRDEVSPIEHITSVLNNGNYIDDNSKTYSLSERHAKETASALTDEVFTYPYWRVNTRQENRGGVDPDFTQELPSASDTFDFVHAGGLVAANTRGIYLRNSTGATISKAPVNQSEVESPIHIEIDAKKNIYTVEPTTDSGPEAVEIKKYDAGFNVRWKNKFEVIFGGGEPGATLFAPQIQVTSNYLFFYGDLPNDNNVTMIDRESGEILDGASVGFIPSHFTMDEDGNVYVAEGVPGNEGTNFTMVRLDITSNDEFEFNYSTEAADVTYQGGLVRNIRDIVAYGDYIWTADDSGNLYRVERESGKREEIYTSILVPTEFDLGNKTFTDGIRHMQVDADGRLYIYRRRPVFLADPGETNTSDDGEYPYNLYVFNTETLTMEAELGYKEIFPQRDPEPNEKAFEEARLEPFRDFEVLPDNKVALIRAPVPEADGASTRDGYDDTSDVIVEQRDMSRFLQNEAINQPEFVSDSGDFNTTIKIEGNVPPKIMESRAMENGYEVNIFPDYDGNEEAWEQFSKIDGKTESQLLDVTGTPTTSSVSNVTNLPEYNSSPTNVNSAPTVTSVDIQTVIETFSDNTPVTSEATQTNELLATGTASFPTNASTLSNKSVASEVTDINNSVRHIATTETTESVSRREILTKCLPTRSQTEPNVYAPHIGIQKTQSTPDVLALTISGSTTDLTADTLSGDYNITSDVIGSTETINIETESTPSRINSEVTQNPPNLIKSEELPAAGFGGVTSASTKDI